MECLLYCPAEKHALDSTFDFGNDHEDDTGMPCTEERMSKDATDIYTGLISHNKNAASVIAY